MSTELANGGATVNPHAQVERAECHPEPNDDRRYAHRWQWVWIAGQWTNNRRCTICDKTEECKS